jgi:hypothetical protein
VSAREASIAVERKGIFALEERRGQAREGAIIMSARGALLRIGS